MKQLLTLCLFLSVTTSAFAQEQLELDGTVKGYKGKVKLLLNTITSDHEADMVNEEIIYMIDGQFKIEKKLEEPTLLSIRIRPEITGDFDPRSFESAFIWVDNKTMTLIADKGNFEYSDVTGYSRQDDNEKANNFVKSRLIAHDQSIDSLSKLQTPEAVEQLSQLKSISKNYLRNQYRLDYCYQYPGGFVSAYNYSWFVKWMPEMVPKSHAKEFYELLDDSIKLSIPGKQIKYYIDHIAVNKSLDVGDSPYNFTLPDSSVNHVTLNSFAGKVLLLDFWASGCGPCRKEHDNYADLYNRFNHQGFEIVSVSQDRSRERWLKAMKKDNMTWVSLWDKDMSISKYTYLVTAIPNNYLINRNGIIIAKNIRGDELGKLLAEAIKD